MILCETLGLKSVLLFPSNTNTGLTVKVTSCICLPCKNLWFIWVAGTSSHSVFCPTVLCLDASYLNHINVFLKTTIWNTSNRSLHALCFSTSTKRWDLTCLRSHIIYFTRHNRPLDRTMSPNRFTLERVLHLGKH